MLLLSGKKYLCYRNLSHSVTSFVYYNPVFKMTANLNFFKGVIPQSGPIDERLLNILFLIAPKVNLKLLFGNEILKHDLFMNLT